MKKKEELSSYELVEMVYLFTNAKKEVYPKELLEKMRKKIIDDYLHNPGTKREVSLYKICLSWFLLYFLLDDSNKNRKIHVDRAKLSALSITKMLNDSTTKSNNKNGRSTQSRKLLVK